MGSDKGNPDLELVKDYATDRTFVRLHLDLDVSEDRYRELGRLMDAESWDDAAEALREETGAASFIELFFGPRLGRPARRSKLSVS